MEVVVGVLAPLTAFLDALFALSPLLLSFMGRLPANAVMIVPLSESFMSLFVTEAIATLAVSVDVFAGVVDLLPFLPFLL
jgi:hypothetical protein